MTDTTDGVTTTLRAAASWCVGKSAHGSDLGLLHVRDLVADLLAADAEYDEAEKALHNPEADRSASILRLGQARTRRAAAIRACRSEP